MSERSWINASDIGQANFCPNSVYLRIRGVRLSAKAERVVASGTKSHQQFNQAMAAGSDKRCVIATHLYGEDHPVTADLRRWRNEKLLVSWHGRMFIAFYYWFGPRVLTLLRWIPPLTSAARKTVKLIHEKTAHRNSERQ